MNLICPKCNRKWNYKGNQWRAQCSCNAWIRTGLPTPWTKSSAITEESSVKSSAITDDIMQGNIIEALEKASIDPFNHNGKISKDFIPLLLKDEELKYAFSKYCEENKKQPLWVVKQAIIIFLKKERYYEK